MFLRVIVLFCGVVCALAALLFWFFWAVSEHRRGAGATVWANFFIVLLLSAAVLSLVAAMHKK